MEKINISHFYHGISGKIAEIIYIIFFRITYGSIISDHEFRSKRPHSHSPGFVGFGLPAIIQRGSYGAFVGTKPTGRSIGSFGITIGIPSPTFDGMYDSHERIV